MQRNNRKKVIERWNQLDQYPVNASSINSFENNKKSRKKSKSAPSLAVSRQRNKTFLFSRFYQDTII